MPQNQKVVIHIELPTKGSFGVTGEAVGKRHLSRNTQLCVIQGKGHPNIGGPWKHKSFSDATAARFAFLAAPAS